MDLSNVVSPYTKQDYLTVHGQVILATKTLSNNAIRLQGLIADLKILTRDNPSLEVYTATFNTRVSVTASTMDTMTALLKLFPAYEAGLEYMQTWAGLFTRTTALLDNSQHKTAIECKKLTIMVSNFNTH